MHFSKSDFFANFARLLQKLSVLKSHTNKIKSIKWQKKERNRPRCNGPK
jgi:hypothetical protein